MEQTIRLLDMGYFGNNHEQYGIVLYIDQHNQTLSVLETTNSPHHRTVDVNVESFVVTRNVNDMCVDAEAKALQAKQAAKQNRPQITACGKEIKVTVCKRNRGVSQILYKANQTYSTAARHNPNYVDIRERILVALMALEADHPNSFNEIAAILESTYDSHNRIVTITADGAGHTFHLTISVIGKQTIVHDASIRYDTPKFSFGEHVKTPPCVKDTGGIMAMV